MMYLSWDYCRFNKRYYVECFTMIILFMMPRGVNVMALLYRNIKVIKLGKIGEG